ncbi:MAG: hypothetical protein PHT96_15215 [Syntrophorhabdaceae bacterium]|jgi:hypothetical protein|nr:hypothetical protein [Syntrophorhabdaceae bacterium]
MPWPISEDEITGNPDIEFKGELGTQYLTAPGGFHCRDGFIIRNQGPKRQGLFPYYRTIIIRKASDTVKPIDARIASASALRCSSILARTTGFAAIDITSSASLSGLSRSWYCGFAFKSFRSAWQKVARDGQT